MDIEIKKKRGKKDVEAKILSIAMILLSEFYDVYINREKFPEEIQE